jgi:SPX domain protein involved in polyphosphate accumulation
VHKILKKHDKLLPHSPCRQFYIAHLHQQPWVQGTYSDVLVHLSNCYSQLRGDQTGQKNEDAAQVGCSRALDSDKLHQAEVGWRVFAGGLTAE